LNQDGQDGLIVPMHDEIRAVGVLGGSVVEKVNILNSIIPLFHQVHTSCTFPDEKNAGDDHIFAWRI
jgi:hypothetical protein